MRTFNHPSFEKKKKNKKKKKLKQTLKSELINGNANKKKLKKKKSIHIKKVLSLTSILCYIFMVTHVELQFQNQQPQNQQPQN